MCKFVEMMWHGEFLNKYRDETRDYFGQSAKNAQSWDNSERSGRSKTTRAKVVSRVGMHVLKKYDDVNARMTNLTRKVEAMELRKTSSAKVIEKEEKICRYA